MKIKVSILIAMIFGLLLLLFNEPNIPGRQEVEEGAQAKVLLHNSIDHRHGIKLVELEDGTRCAIYTEVHKGGISCDWNSK